MKDHILKLMAVVLMACWISGCTGGSADVNTDQLKQSFQTAPPAVKAEVDKAVIAIESGDFGAASVALKAAVKPGGLNPEQKTAVADVVSQMQMIASQKPDKYPGDVYRSIGDVIPIMEGQIPPVPMDTRPAQ